MTDIADEDKIRSSRRHYRDIGLAFPRANQTPIAGVLQNLIAGEVSYGSRVNCDTRHIVVGEKLIQFLVIGRVEPIHMAHFHCQADVTGPNGEKGLQFRDMLRRETRWKLEEHGSKPVTQSTHPFDELFRTRDIIQQRSFMAD